MQTYWSILEKVKGSSLRLTKFDDDIYNHLKEAFPEFDPAAKVDEDAMKSKSGKERWRAFMLAYEKKIGDYNFGTMVRNSPKVEYEEDTTVFGKEKMSTRSPKIAFLTCLVLQYLVCNFTRLKLHGKFNSIAISLTSSNHTFSNKSGLNDWVYEQAQAQAGKPTGK